MAPHFFLYLPLYRRHSDPWPGLLNLAPAMSMRRWKMQYSDLSSRPVASALRSSHTINHFRKTMTSFLPLLRFPMLCSFTLIPRLLPTAKRSIPAFWNLGLFQTQIFPSNYLYCTSNVIAWGMHARCLMICGTELCLLIIIWLVAISNKTKLKSLLV